jgi:hypothetical protein
VKSSRAPRGFTDTAGHMPFAESAVEKSVTTLIATNVALPSFQEGYAEWRRAFDNGKGGFFTVSVAEGVGFIETAMNQ